MEKYIIKKNQNIFDVSVQLYGSVEGMFDLMVNNPDFSFDTDLKAGQELYWDGDFVEHQQIVDWLNQKNIIPTNSSRHIYYKNTDKDLKCAIKISADRSNLILKIAGDGVITVDWGDNSDLEDIILQPTVQTYQHFFDNQTEARIIRLYGDFNIKVWDLSPVNGLVLPTMPITADEIEVHDKPISMDGFKLFNGTYSVKLSGISIDTLDYIKDMNLSYLEILNAEYDSTKVLDDYLIYLATHHNQRRNCTVVLDHQPSGAYREPEKDVSGNYIIKTGMEAIYVIIHEPTWNEAGPWIFRINDKEYAADNLAFNYRLSFIMEQ